MSSSPVPPAANVRVLELFFEVFSSHRGRTKAQLRTLRGYASLSDEAFETQFQRDKDALRDAGVSLVVRGGEERYWIHEDTFATDTQVTATDRILISLAAGVWAPSEIATDAVEAKTAASSDADQIVGGVHIGLRGARASAALMRALREHYVVSFLYPGSDGLMERSVEPWSLVLRGRALYMSGWDLDRQAQRIFRLSRIASDVTFLGEAGDAPASPVPLEDPFTSQLVSPTVALREGSAAWRVLYGYEATASYPVNWQRPGWTVLTLEEGEVGEWMSRLFPLVEDVVVLAPTHVREAMLTRLESAALWKDDRA